MANKSLFSNRKGSVVAKPDTTNLAGGSAYSLEARSSLAKLACTGTLNSTFYASAQTQLDQTITLMDQIDTEFLCKLAIYARHDGYMKDMPAFIMAYLMGRETNPLVDATFHKVIDNGRMVRNFVQIMMSGQINNRKSLGSRPRRLVREWLNNKDAETLFRDSIGNAPSLGDVIRLSHPRPKNKSFESLFSYFITGKVDKNTPKFVREYESWKKDTSKEWPDVPHLMLTAHNLTINQWKQIESTMGWQALRINLNTLQRHSVFDDKNMVTKIAARLIDKTEIAKSKVFPYQIMSAYLNRNADMPSQISNALQDAIDYSVLNVPALEGDTIILVDVSGSMGDPITGRNGSASSKVKCRDVAALLASTILAKNQNNTTILAFDTSTRPIQLNPRDSVITNASKINTPGGGTNVEQALKYLNTNNIRGKNVIIVSDNMSWGHFAGQIPQEWNTFLTKNKGAKVALIDIVPNIKSVLPDRPGILNCGGFSDAVFSILNSFFGEKQNFVEQIDKITV